LNARGKHVPIDARTKSRLANSARLLSEYRFQIWNYGDSVGFEGLLCATTILSDLRYRGFVHGALKAWSARALPYRELDNTFPGHAACALYEETRDPSLMMALVDLSRFLMSRRLIKGAYAAFESSPVVPPYGGIRVTATEASLITQPGAGVFVDCLHFDPPFFVHLGRLLDDDVLVRTGIEQAMAYIEVLQDPESMLFSHFYLERTRRAYGLGWGRGQGWALLGLFDVLEYVGADEPERQALIDATLGLCQALVRTQQPDGSWRAVVSDPLAREEASTAAFAACGFLRGVRLGILDESFLEPALRAWGRTTDLMDDEGRLGLVSAAVFPTTSLASYSHVSTGHLVPWGLGPLIMAAAEVDLIDSKRSSA
jgi:unsaturated rhamnogalacturonyl hydrolase